MSDSHGQASRFTASKWTEEQKASLVEAIRPFEKGKGLVNWKAAREAGVISRIEQEFGRPEKTIKAYYNNQFRRNFWNVSGAKRVKYKPRKQAAMVVKQPPQPAPEKSVETLNYCPRCALPLGPIKAAINL